MAKLTAAQLESILVSVNGNYSKAAEVARDAYGITITRQAIHDRVSKSQRLQDACQNARESVVDLAENKLADKISEGDMRAILFTLETMGKNRGWTKKLEVDQTSTISVAGILAELERRKEAASEREKAEIQKGVRGIVGEAPTLEVHFVETDGNGHLRELAPGE